eukprot:SAG22_NODE_2639_length_2347_cov_2.181940_1_plen_48_part_10
MAGAAGDSRQQLHLHHSTFRHRAIVTPPRASDTPEGQGADGGPAVAGS